MSRQVTFTAVFRNGVRRSYGAYNPTNAEYYESLLVNSEVYEALHNLANYCEGKRVLRVEIRIEVSTGHSSINKVLPVLRLTEKLSYFDTGKVQKSIVYTRIANDLYKPNTN